MITVDKDNNSRPTETCSCIEHYKTLQNITIIQNKVKTNGIIHGKIIRQNLHFKFTFIAFITEPVARNALLH